MLHRLYLAGWITLVVGGAVWLYPRTGLSEPLLDWYAVWQNGGSASSKPLEHLSGTVVNITDGTTFALRTADRQLYSIGLAGVVQPPPTPVHPRGRKSPDVDPAWTALRHLILSNSVEVEVTALDSFHRGLGVVYLGSTNINAALIESGVVQLKHEFIKELPLMEQYQLLRAERRAGGQGAKDSSKPAIGLR